MKYKAYIPVVIYNLAVIVVLFLAMFVFENDGIGEFLIQAPIFPWGLITFGIAAFGYVFAFALNNVLIYLFTRYIIGKKRGSANENDAPISFRRIPLLALIMVGGYLVWTAEIIYYAETCTGKFCELVLIFSLSPLLFLVSPLESFVSELGAILITVFANAAILFFIGVITEKLYRRWRKRKKEKEPSSTEQSSSLPQS